MARSEAILPRRFVLPVSLLFVNALFRVFEEIWQVFDLPGKLLAYSYVLCRGRRMTLLQDNFQVTAQRTGLILSQRKGRISPIPDRFLCHAPSFLAWWNGSLDAISLSLTHQLLRRRENFSFGAVLFLRLIGEPCGPVPASPRPPDGVLWCGGLGMFFLVSGSHVVEGHYI